MTTTVRAAGTDNRIRLGDGRTLGYSECGALDGPIVVLLHGTPGSRLLGPILHDEALSCGVRLICPDRPGYGYSTFRRHSLLEYVTDLVQLADALDAGRFAVLGVSGGGPFALASAASIPERLTGVAVVSCVGPTESDDSLNFIGGSDRSLIKLARRASWAVTPVVRVEAAVARRFAGRLVASTMKSLPQADRASLQDPDRSAALTATTVEAFRQGGRAFAWDEILFSRHWGFRPEDIKMPVLLWHGEEDTTILPEMGRRLAEAIPNCSATFCAGAGHYLIAAHITDILSALTANSGRGRESSPAGGSGSLS